MIKMPEVKFEIINVEDEIRDIEDILHGEDEGAVEEIFFNHPMLLRRLKKSSNDLESNKIIAKFFRAAAKDGKGKATKYKQVFQRIWNIVNNDFMKIISDLMSIKIREDEVFTGNVTFSPIKKINENKNEFKIFVKTKNRETKDIVFSEVSRILFLKKFKEIFGDLEDIELKNHFIEIIIRQVLLDNKFQRISIYKPKISDQYKNIIIGDRFLLNIIERMYNEKTTFDDFLKDVWKFLKKNKKSIDDQFEANIIK